MKQRNYFLLVGLVVLFFLLSFGRVFFLNVVKKESYQELMHTKTNRQVTGSSAPRGRILDCNGKVLVDNIGVKTISYKRVNGISSSDEIEIAYLLANILDLDKMPTEYDLKRFWILLHTKEADALITKEEYKAYEERKLSSTDLYHLKLERIPKAEIESFTLEDQMAALLHQAMTKGYSYTSKVLKNGASEQEVALVLERKIPGVVSEMSWERIYPYGESLRNVFGSVSSWESGIPAEEANYFQELGYQLDERVGISFLERQYESYLKGEKAIYRINSDQTLSLVTESKRGNDLVLNIDIELQLEVESILKKQMEKGKKLKNTEYYNHSYVLISEPKTGAIKAFSGQQILKGTTSYHFRDISANAITSSYTMGSIVKGASMAVAYQNGVIKGGEKIKDSCVKLNHVPSKCSFKSLGVLDDIGALKWSSNYFQFLLAIGLTGQKYTYNMDLNATETHFNLYRDMFSSFGLGTYTGIDLPKESLGLKGEKIADDLYLNFAIGQYDTYTPVQVLQYINTIANEGARISLSLMKEIRSSSGEVIIKNEGTVLNNVSLDNQYFKRIKEGMHQVMMSGTAASYASHDLNAAGKTGTSESFYDADGDGTYETKTISMAFGMFAPTDQPKYSMLVISPHVSHYNGNSDYIAYINKYISKDIAKILFENY